MKKAVIIGSHGQDGQLLLDLLKRKNYSTVGIDKGKTDIDITDKKEVFDLIKKIKPDEIYYLAAVHQSSQDKLIEDYQLFKSSYQINVFGLLNFLEAVKSFSPKSRIFYAASSLIFASTPTTIQNENTPFCPNSVYGITKLNGLLICRLYRKQHGVFASVGILYNHESSLRQDNFLSQRIIQGAIAIQKHQSDKLTLGNLKARIDWGYAPEYVEAMQKILNYSQPDEFIIATGKQHSVADFAKITFQYLRLNWKKYIKVNPNLITKEQSSLIGNNLKLFRATGWKPKISFEKMIKTMLIQQGAKIYEK